MLDHALRETIAIEPGAIDRDAILGTRLIFGDDE
jgi:hypothetical protein